MTIPVAKITAAIMIPTATLPLRNSSISSSPGVKASKIFVTMPKDTPMAREATIVQAKARPNSKKISLTGRLFLNLRSSSCHSERRSTPQRSEKSLVFHQLEEFLYPENLRQAVQKKHEYGDAAAPIAGGTEIVPNLPPGIRCLIDVTRLGLSYVDSQPDSLRIGATTTMHELALSPAIAQLADGLLSSSCCQGWPQQVRTTATIGGNLVGGGPFADSPPALLALDAQAVVARLDGDETIPLEDFFLDYRRTAVGTGILREIRIPRPEPGTRGVFLKYSRSPIDQALVNLAITVKLEAACVRRVRVALGAVGRIPLRLVAAEQALLNRPLDQHSIDSACSVVEELIDPILDLRASADYRRQLAGKLTRRALLQIAS